jgi:serine/threonine-protein kinase mTOR
MHDTQTAPNVIYAHMKLSWVQGTDREANLARMRHFAQTIAGELQRQENEPFPAKPSSNWRTKELSRLLARCHYKIGEWQSALEQDWDTVCIELHAQLNSVLIILSEKYGSHPSVVSSCYSL